MVHAQLGAQAIWHCFCCLSDWSGQKKPRNKLNPKLQLLFSLNFEQAITVTNSWIFAISNILLNKPVARQNPCDGDNNTALPKRYQNMIMCFIHANINQPFFNPLCLLQQFSIIGLLASLKFWTKQSFSAKEGIAVSKYRFFWVCPTKHIQGLCNCSDNTGEDSFVSRVPSVQRNTGPHSSTAPNPVSFPWHPAHPLLPPQENSSAHAQVRAHKAQTGAYLGGRAEGLNWRLSFSSPVLVSTSWSTGLASPEGQLYRHKLWSWKAAVTAFCPPLRYLSLALTQQEGYIDQLR